MKKNNANNKMSENEINDTEMESDNPSLKNGVLCHQCRHKTYGVHASCKNQAKTKPCLLKYCEPCLLNRYGEKAEDVTLLDEWDCPRCRGVCNCSTCMKKRGHQPTGIVKAKAGGFTSVSDMIHEKGAENVCSYKRVKETCASPRKQGGSTEGNLITSPKKSGKENLLDGKTDSNTDPLLSVPSPVKENPTKKKRKGVEVMPDDTGVRDKALNEKKQKKPKLKASKEIVGGKVNDGEAEENTITAHQNATQHLKDNQSRKVKKNELNSFGSVNSLPTGSELVTVAGFDLPKEDAGNALQLLEFCSTFGKILDVKTGQAEAALKDLIKGRSARRGKFTSLVQLHIQLLSVILEESGSESELESSESDPNDNDSWLKVLKNCISNSQLKHLDSIDTTAAGYDNLELSTKLGLLIFLCDEVLGTQKIRTWIDEENAKLAEKKKEAKGKLCAAKNKEKSLKQKIQDEVAKATIANYGVPITSKEYDAIVSRIKNKEAAEHAEMLECKTMGLEDKEKFDAVRTEPIFKDNKGHMYWRLKGCSDNPGILLQDIGTGDHMVGEVDKWFEFDDEQMNLIEGHVNLLRSRLKNY